MSDDGLLPDGVSHAAIDAAAPPCAEAEEFDPAMEEPLWLFDGPGPEGDDMAEKPDIQRIMEERRLKGRKYTPSPVATRRDALVASVEARIDSICGQSKLPQELVGVAVWEAVAEVVSKVDLVASVRTALLGRLGEG